MSNGIRTRFAPSPTGYMHIGNLRTALYAYLLAKKLKGKLILRIEDTDRERYIDDAVNVIYETLDLAGIVHDEGPDKGGDFGPYVQSERKSIYNEWVKVLLDNGNAYYCFCDKERLDSLKVGPETEYDRHCLNLTREEIQANLESGKPHVIRQRMPDGGSTSFEDLVYGTISVENDQLDDQILIKSDGMPTYNFAHVVDDHLMAITHVVRGNEYLSSTPKYILLYGAFGWDIPEYIHLPLILRSTGQKLSKRAGDPSFGDLICQGYLPPAIINYVALLGWNPGDVREIFSLNDLIDAFHISGINRAPAIFDINKLSWMNGEYVHNLDDDSFHGLALPYYEKMNLPETVDLVRLSALLKPRTDVLSAIPEQIDFLEELPSYSPDLYSHKKLKTDPDICLNALTVAEKEFENILDWNNDTIFNSINQFSKRVGLKSRQVLWALRVALSGKAATPGGASEIAQMLGKKESIRRIRKGMDIIKGGNLNG